VARALCRAAGGAIVSTSANPSGGPPPAEPAALDCDLAARLDGFLDAGPSPGGLPSTVVAVAGDRLTLLRDGAIPFTSIAAFALLAPAGALG
jgi:L-threonylcarbamoyladenylate synthase